MRGGRAYSRSSGRSLAEPGALLRQGEAGLNESMFNSVPETTNGGSARSTRSGGGARLLVLDVTGGSRRVPTGDAAGRRTYLLRRMRAVGQWLICPRRPGLLASVPRVGVAAAKAETLAGSGLEPVAPRAGRGILGACRACTRPQAAARACSAWPRRGTAG